MLLEKFYTPPKVAKILGTSSDHIQKLIRDGELKATNLSRGDRPRWKINPVDFQAFLDSRSNQVQAKPDKRRRQIPVPTKSYV